MATGTATRELLGPLTTTFTAPAKCRVPYVASDFSDGIYVRYGLTCSSSSIGFDTDCYPSGIASWFNSNSLTELAAHSPASICPSGWTSACAVTKSPGDSVFSATADNLLWLQLEYGETAIGCCLRGYDCDPDYYQQCTSQMTFNQVVSGTSYSSCVATANTQTATQTQATPAGLIWKIVLIDGTPTSVNPQSTRSVSSPSVNPTDGSISRPDTNETGTGSSSSGGLSTGAKAGIGVGVALGVILLAALAFFLFRRHRKNKIAAAPTPAAAAAAAAPAAGPNNPPGPAPAGVPVMAQTGYYQPPPPPGQEKPLGHGNEAPMYPGPNGFYAQNGKQEHDPNANQYGQYAQYGQQPQPSAPNSPGLSHTSPAPTYSAWGGSNEVRHEMDSTVVGSGSVGNTNSLLGGGGSTVGGGQSVSAPSVSGAPTSPGGFGGASGVSPSPGPGESRLYELDASQAAHVR